MSAHSGERVEGLDVANVAQGVKGCEAVFPFNPFQAFDGMRAWVEALEAALLAAEAENERLREAAQGLRDHTICRRFTMEFCRHRPELPREEWCLTCERAERVSEALTRPEDSPNEGGGGA